MFSIFVIFKLKIWKYIKTKRYRYSALFQSFNYYFLFAGLLGCTGVFEAGLAWTFGAGFWLAIWFHLPFLYHYRHSLCVLVGDTNSIISVDFIGWLAPKYSCKWEVLNFTLIIYLFKQIYNHFLYDLSLFFMHFFKLYVYYKSFLQTAHIYVLLLAQSGLIFPFE